MDHPPSLPPTSSPLPAAPSVPLPPPVGYCGPGGGYPLSSGDFQVRQDAEHLRLLSIFHYIVGGLTGFFGCFGLIYLGLGIMFIAMPEAMQGNGARHAVNEPPPAFLGWLFAGIGTVITLFAWAVAGLTIYSGRCLKRRQKRTLSLVTAGLNCLQVPLGTALGVFTFMVLNRPSVQALYRPSSSPSGQS